MNYARKLDIGLLCPNMEIRPPGPQKWNFSKFLHFCGKVSTLQFSLPTSPQPPQTLILNQVIQENGILAKYGNSAPGSQKWNFSKKIHFFEKVSRFRFQQALSHPQTLSLSQVMQENVILAYYAQIWKFGPRLQKWNFSKSFHFSEKVFRFRF